MFFLKARYFFLIAAVIFFVGCQAAYALTPGDAVPDSNASAAVRPGEVARPLSVLNLDGDIVRIDFKDKPTVLVSLGLESNIAKMAEWQKFYDSYKNEINFYVLAHEGKERMQSIIKQQDFSMPIFLDDKLSFIRKYNNAVPALFITDKDAVIVYNSEMAVNMDSVTEFLDKLSNDGKSALPKLRYVPLIQPKPRELPPLMNTGTVVKEEVFAQMNGGDYAVQFTGKPTILLFWAAFNQPQTLSRELTALQKAYEVLKNKASFYTVNFANDKRAAEILAQNQSTVPALIDKDGVYLRYLRSFPSVVIIDKNGVIRYRPNGALTAESLEKLLTSCDSAYATLPQPKTASEWVMCGDEILKDTNRYYTEAIDAYHQAVVLDPGCYDAYFKMAKLYHERDNDRQALENADAMLVLKPNDLAGCYLRLSILVKMQNAARALSDCDKILALKPDEFEVAFTRAGIYRSQGKYDLAAGQYTKLLGGAPTVKEIAVYMNRGDCYLALSKHDLAVADYNKVIGLNPAFSYAYFYRGLALMGQKNYDGAAADYTKAIAIKPLEEYYEQRAILYLVTKQDALALDDLTTIITMNPKFKYTYFNRGMLLVKKGCYAAAADDFAAEKKQYPRNGELLFALAQTLELLGDKEQALQNYTDAVEYLPLKSTDKIHKAQKRTEGDWESDQGWLN